MNNNSCNLKSKLIHKKYLKLLVKVPALFLVMLNVISGSAWAYSDQLDFDENKLLMVFRPDSGHPIIWHFANKYRVDWSSLIAASCANTCPAAAIAMGAATYKIQVVTGYGTVIAYFNAAGELIGTGEDLDGDGVGNDSDPDADGDGVANGQDAYPFDPAPTITLSSPNDGAIYNVGQTATLAATVSDNGSINHVEFYVNGNLVNTDSSAPYQFGWQAPAEGQYTISAMAMDNLGQTTSSSSHSVTISQSANLNSRVIFIHTDLLGSPSAESYE